MCISHPLQNMNFRSLGICLDLPIYLNVSKASEQPAEFPANRVARLLT
jgi:hypothetical protein